MTTVAADFTRDPEAIEADATRLEEKSRRFGTWRVSLFGVVLLGAILGISIDAAWAQFVALPALALFPLLIVLHHRVDRERRRLEDVFTVVREERLRRTGEFRFEPSPTPSRANERYLTYRDANTEAESEAFALDRGVVDDLALAGTGRTVFGLLDQTSTIFGALRLESFLTHPLLDATAIRRRQDAVDELARRDADRRTLLHGLLGLRRHDFEPVPDDLETPARFVDRRLLQLTTKFLFVATVGTLLGGVVWNPVCFYLTFVLLTFNVAVIGLNSGQSNPARQRFARLGHLGRAVLVLERELDRLELESEEWRTISSELTRAKPAMTALSKAVGRLEWHELGLFFEVWNAFTLWELRALPLAERLVRDHRTEIEACLVALGHAEALLALSCALAEQPGFSLPTPIERERPEIHAEELGHPLLPAGVRVTNGLDFDPASRIVVVTGSNMSGKSTYLKATGINLVLAGAGAPVCASRFEWTPLRLYTDVNIRDSLDDGKSYFQVEVERVRTVLEETARGPFMLGIFDELFRGTNAHERYAISAALVDFLLETGTLLLLATHDDRLATRVESIDAVRNIHFREIMEAHELAFTYQLQEGRARTRNAIRVLDRLGYPRPVVETARQLSGESPDESHP